MIYLYQIKTYLNKLIDFSCFERLDSHMGTEKRPTVGSSGEY